jgi:DivIVA domain-containing protein
MEVVMSEEQRREEPTSRSVSPRTVREFTAPAAIRGYDRDTVDDFLKEVAASYEVALRDVETLQRRLSELQRVSDESDPSWADETDDATSIEALRRELRKYREREHAVGAALVVAQKNAAALRSKAEKEAEALRSAAAEVLEHQRDAAKEEAERIVADARLQAKKIQEEASSERSLFEEELNRLRSLKEATRQDLSEFLTEALRGLEESASDDQALVSAATKENKAQQSSSSR